MNKLIAVAVALITTCGKASSAEICQLHFPKQSVGTVQISPTKDQYVNHPKELDACGDITLVPNQGVTVVFHDGREGWIKTLNNQLTSVICGLDFSRCDAAGLTSQDLRHYRELRLLRLRDTDVGDEASDAAAALPKLTLLDVSRSKVTVAGLYKWLQPNTVRFLYANNIDCRNRNLMFLQKAFLKELHLTACGLDDAAVKTLSRSATLEVLSIDRNQNITDLSIESLIKMPILREINLSETSCTMQGFKKLANCKKLTRLYLSQRRFTEKEITELRHSLPHCEILSGAERRIQGDPFELFAPMH